MKPQNPLNEVLDKAKKSGCYMVSVWYREGLELRQTRITEKFPVKDIDLAVDMLKKDLEKLTTPIALPDNTIQPPRKRTKKKA